MIILLWSNGGGFDLRLIGLTEYVTVFFLYILSQKHHSFTKSWRSHIKSSWPPEGAAGLRPAVSTYPVRHKRSCGFCFLRRVRPVPVRCTCGPETVRAAHTEDHSGSGVLLCPGSAGLVLVIVVGVVRTGRLTLVQVLSDHCTVGYFCNNKTTAEKYFPLRKKKRSRLSSCAEIFSLIGWYCRWGDVSGERSDIHGQKQRSTQPWRFSQKVVQKLTFWVILRTQACVCVFSQFESLSPNLCLFKLSPLFDLSSCACWLMSDKPRTSFESAKISWVKVKVCKDQNHTSKTLRLRSKWQQTQRKSQFCPPTPPQRPPTPRCSLPPLHPHPHPGQFNLWWILL